MLCKVRMLGMVFVPWNSFGIWWIPCRAWLHAGNARLTMGRGMVSLVVSSVNVKWEGEMGNPAVQGENAKQIRDQVIGDIMFLFFFFLGSNMKQWPVTHIDWIWRWSHGANHGAPKMEPKWWWFNENPPQKIPETFRYRNSMDNAYILSSRPSLLSIIHFHATAIPSQATRVCTSWTRLAGCF